MAGSVAVRPIVDHEGATGCGPGRLPRSNSVHIPNLSLIVRPLRHADCYFRTGVKVEGEAWLCESPHGIFVGFDGPPNTTGRNWPQHVDVEVHFWNRRNNPVTVLDVASIALPWRDVELAVATSDPFKPVTLGSDGAQQTREFGLVPKDAPDQRVEAAVGDPLEIEFRPSRGSERWARPRIRLTLKTRH